MTSPDVLLTRKDKLGIKQPNHRLPNKSAVLGTDQMFTISDLESARVSLKLGIKQFVSYLRTLKKDIFKSEHSNVETFDISLPFASISHYSST